MPVGKGSLEVIQVGPGISECRMVKVTPGAQIFVGDIVANLVYDRNLKWSFKVYGNFDLDQNGMATAADTEIVKRLIVQWGSRLSEQVTPDTDFVVLGKEPEVPTVDKDSATPLDVFEQEKAEAALRAYEEVRNKALELGIPVLNQNRFLYLIGYYDLAQR
jgi:hypothetical protein